MEVNLKNQLHIEFYGLPGCGKSTVSHLLYQKLKESGAAVFEPSYSFDHRASPIIRKLFKLCSSAFFAAVHFGKFKRLKDCCTKTAKVGFGEFLKQAVSIIPKIRTYRERKTAIYVWDEGLVQSAISLALRGNSDSAEIEKELLAIVGNKKTVKVLLATEQDVALSRMEHRATNDSIVEKESDEHKRKDILNLFEKCVSQVAMPDIKIDCTNKTPEELCDLIFEKLFELRVY